MDQGGQVHHVVDVVESRRDVIRRARVAVHHAISVRRILFRLAQGRHPCAGLGEPERGRAADAAGRAGDHDPLAVEVGRGSVQVPFRHNHIEDARNGRKPGVALCREEALLAWQTGGNPLPCAAHWHTLALAGRTKTGCRD